MIWSVLAVFVNSVFDVSYNVWVPGSETFHSSLSWVHREDNLLKSFNKNKVGMRESSWSPFYGLELRWTHYILVCSGDISLCSLVDLQLLLLVAYTTLGSLWLHLLWELLSEYFLESSRWFLILFMTLKRSFWNKSYCTWTTNSVFDTICGKALVNGTGEGALMGGEDSCGTW